MCACHFSLGDDVLRQVAERALYLRCSQVRRTAGLNFHDANHWSVNFILFCLALSDDIRPPVGNIERLRPFHQRHLYYRRPAAINSWFFTDVGG